MSAVLLVLLVLASWRLTRLITTDRITEGPRERLVARWGAESKRGYFLTCDFCVGAYISGLVVLAYWLLVDGGLDAPALWWGAVAAGVPIVSLLVEALEEAGD